MAFPGAGAHVIYNDAGEPLGWDYPHEPDPNDAADDYDRAPSAAEDAADDAYERGYSDGDAGDEDAAQDDADPLADAYRDGYAAGKADRTAREAAAAFARLHADADEWVDPEAETRRLERYEVRPITDAELEHELGAVEIVRDEPEPER